MRLRYAEGETIMLLAISWLAVAVACGGVIANEVA
jgi:hypothetical protein